MNVPMPASGLLLMAVTLGWLTPAPVSADLRPLAASFPRSCVGASRGAVPRLPAASVPRRGPEGVQKKVYVATELESAITVVNAATNEVLRKVQLGYRIPPFEMTFYPKSIAVAPDGRSVWITAPIPIPECADGEGGMDGGPYLPPNAAEEIIILDPQADTVLGRIPVPRLDSTHLHLINVVIDQDSRFAYVLANGTSQVVRVDMQTRQIMGRVELGLNRDPQGMNLCEDRIVVANAAGKSLSVVDLTRGTAEEIPLDGVAVRAVCSPDVRFAYVTLYDRKEIVRYEFATGALTRWPLPRTAAGPTQMVLDPKGTRLYVLDQGTLLNLPNGDKMFEVDARTGKLAATIQVGRAPRGLRLSDDGKVAYTANYYDAGITVVDLSLRKAVATVRTGIAPHGVAVWVNPDPLVQ